MNNSPTCPYCGHVEHDIEDINFGPSFDGDAVASCNSCGGEYFCKRIVSVRYESAELKTQDGITKGNT